MKLPAFVARYRTQALIALGGIAAVFAYQSRMQQAARVADTPTVAADQAGAFWQGIQAGAAIQGSGVAQGIAPTEAALGLAGQAVSASSVAAQGAQGLARAISGDFTGLGGLLGSALAGIASSIGLAPQPPPPPAAAPPPASVPPPPPATAQPAPTPPAAVATEVTYRAIVPGNVQFFGVPYPGDGRVTGERWNTHGPGSWANAARLDSGGVLHWQLTNGGMAGWSLIPGRSQGDWSITRQTYERLADGTRRLIADVPIGRSGS